MKPLGLLLLMTLSGLAGAQTYECVEDGRLTISDTPCPPGADPGQRRPKE
jgi:hypothetical protein